MDLSFLILTFSLLFIIAFLYSSVGHAGASGYLAVLALLSFPVAAIKPTSLVLNIVVSLVASYKFIRAGYFNKRVFVSFAVTSIPFSFLGGYLDINPLYFKIFAGVFLICSALLLVLKTFIKPAQQRRLPSLCITASIGAAIGLLSGLIGVGGGVFLSPIIILLGYTTAKETSGTAALFILCNSLLGLAGHYAKLQVLDVTILYWVVAVFAGGLSGAHFGASKINNRYIIVMLFVVLLSAGVKFLIVG